MNTRRTPDLDDLNPDQRARIIEFRDSHGKGWKATLSSMWWDGRDADQRDGHLLRQVRNQYGPAWLRELKE
jgi:hypothetical protein